jgi:hypothetical protein
MGLHNTSGKINTTTVVGNTLVGKSAADGGINIVLDDVGGHGVHHPSGAIRVNSSNGTSYYDPSGAVYTNKLMGPGR